MSFDDNQKPPKDDDSLPDTMPDQPGMRAVEIISMVYEQLNETARAKGHTFAQATLAHFITAFIGSLVLKTLETTPREQMTREEQYKFTHHNFEHLKELIQNSVAEGVGQACSEWSGMDVDYYCLLRPFPETKNMVVN